MSKFIKDRAKAEGKEAPKETEDHNKMVADIFKHEDKDKDGHISFTEFSGPKKEEL